MRRLNQASFVLLCLVLFAFSGLSLVFVVLAGGPFQFLSPISGTVSMHMSHQHRRSRFFGSVLRLFYSFAPT